MNVSNIGVLGKSRFVSVILTMSIGSRRSGAVRLVTTPSGQAGKFFFLEIIMAINGT